MDGCAGAVSMSGPLLVIAVVVVERADDVSVSVVLTEFMLQRDGIDVSNESFSGLSRSRLRSAPCRFLPARSVVS